MAALFCMCVRIARAQDSPSIHRDVLRGIVTSDSVHGLPNVDVIISMAPDRSFLRTLTDSAGRYEITFEHGTGDYLVHVSAAGMQTVRKRVTRTGSDSLFTVNVVLPRAGVEQLSAVRITARRPTHSRNGDYGDAPGTGAMERVVDGVNGAVSPGMAGDIAALAATTPSLLITPNGVSAGGVPSVQNSTTLNGMTFPGAVIPRDAMTHLRVRTSVYDPSEGWFGGAQQAVTLSSGVPITMRHAHLTLDAEALQYTDPYSAAVGQRFNASRVGFGSTGFADHDQLEFNYGVEAGRRTEDGVSLSSASVDVLNRVGVARDSAARLITALDNLGVPRGGPGRRMTSSGSFVGMIGSRDFNFATFTRARTVWDVVGYASTSRTNNVAASPIATRASAASTSDDAGSLQAHLSTYVHELYLLDARSALSLTRARTTPFLHVPTGVVSIESELGSELGDGSRGFNSVKFGGSDAAADLLTQYTWETAANLKLYGPGSSTHRIKIAADSRLDGWRRAGMWNSAGTFAYNSVADVANNQPVSFTRTLVGQAQAASTWNGFISLGDWWRKSDAFQLLYGARLEGNRFLGALPYNPAVASTFGVRTDFVPNTIHVSPRIGFTYTMRGNSGGVTTGPIGTFNGTPTGYLRGGIGEFRTMMSPALVGRVSASDGAARGGRTITCIGAAVPTPQWSSYENDPSLIPADCVDGAAQRAYTDAAPGVELLDRSYSAPRSWRANLAYGTVVNGAVVSLEGAYSLNVRQTGRTDLNFADQVRFVTSDEGRAVYVEPGAIVPASGALVATTSRRDGSFGRVLDDISSLRSTNRQVTLSVSPDPRRIKGWFTSAAYTLSSTRALSSGFDNSTFGSPKTRQWGRGDFDARHRVVLQGGVTGHGLTFTLFGRLQSGFPFTPMIGSDVNGDGFVNDRAFIFQPAYTVDSSLAAEMRSLLGSPQKGVRQCLAAQLGRAASANSCEGPWTASLNAQRDYQLVFPRTHRVAHVAMAFINPLGGIDQMLHGADHLRGWGASAFPDPVLFNVRGFDPATSQYRYSVNPRFGSTLPAAGRARTPSGVTLDFSIDLAPPVDRQVIGLLLRPGRDGVPGKRLNAESIKRRYAVITPDPYTGIMEETDSLMLSPRQTDALQDAGDLYRARRDTILTAMAEYLAALGDRFDARDAVRHQNDALAAVWDIGHESIRRTLPNVLTPLQLRMLPWPANRLYAAPEDVKGTALASF
jgi:hypothetical protein